MFHKEDLTSGKKGGKDKMLLFGLILNRMVHSFDGLKEGPS
jgi:hypothetical protein